MLSSIHPLKKSQKQVLAAMPFLVPQSTPFPSVNANIVVQIWPVMTFHLAMLNKKQIFHWSISLFVIILFIIIILFLFFCCIFVFNDKIKNAFKKKSTFNIIQL